MGTSRPLSPSGSQRHYQTLLPIDDHSESVAKPIDDIMASTGEPSKVTPFLIYLVLITTFGPLQFGFHLVGILVSLSRLLLTEL
jgi:hypothetical protein